MPIAAQFSELGQIGESSQWQCDRRKQRWKRDGGKEEGDFCCFSSAHRSAWLKGRGRHRGGLERPLLRGVNKVLSLAGWVGSGHDFSSLSPPVSSLSRPDNNNRVGESSVLFLYVTVSPSVLPSRNGLANQRREGASKRGASSSAIPRLEGGKEVRKDV